MLVGEGFKVMAYTNDDLVTALRLEDAGCVSVMPLASPIGSGLGLVNPYFIREIKRRLSVPVIVDAGVGTASDACVTMEQGVDGILMNTALAGADDPVAMARAMHYAVRAGRLAFRAGRMPAREIAVPSSPTRGIAGLTPARVVVTPGRRAALAALRASNRGRRLDLALAQAARHLDERERRSRARAHLRDRAAAGTPGPPARASAPPRVRRRESRASRRAPAGAYQLLHMEVPDYAAVSQAVDLAPTHGAGLVNAVLRAVGRRGENPADFPGPERELGAWLADVGIPSALAGGPLALPLSGRRREGAGATRQPAAVH